jgi:hypothetical protein
MIRQQHPAGEGVILEHELNQRTRKRNWESSKLIRRTYTISFLKGSEEQDS